MDGDKRNTSRSFVRVLARYCVAIGVRTFAALKNWDEERVDPVLKAFAKYSEVQSSILSQPCIIRVRRRQT